MWKAKSSCSPTAASGDATATTRSTIPSAKSPACASRAPAARVARASRAHRVGDRDQADRGELEWGERPAREQ